MSGVHRWFRFVLLVTALSVVPLVLQACGEATEGASQSVPRTLFGSQKWGFSVQYPTSCQKLEREPDEESGALVTYVFAEPSGAEAEGAMLDLLQVSVFRLRPAATEQDLLDSKATFEQLSQQLLVGRKELRVVTPYTVEAVGNAKGLTAQYVFVSQGRELAGIFYLVPRGDRLYWANVQTSRQTWDTTGRKLGSSLQTLTFQE